MNTPGYYVIHAVRCPHCNGKGAIKASADDRRIDWSQCGNCKGEGVTTTTVELREALVALGALRPTGQPGG